MPVTGSLFCSREDPYAVPITFRVGLEKPVEWVFARDLLSMGIEGREGVGDVHLWPSAGSESGEPGSVLNIGFASPFGQARFETPGGEVADFLRRGYRIVPAGEESDYIDIEAELNDLLRQGS